jgi:hypothetical protein
MTVRFVSDGVSVASSSSENHHRASIRVGECGPRTEHVLRNVGERSSRARVAKELAIRLSALVNLQIQPLNGIFLPGHHNFPVQCQFPRTRQPLYLKLQTNQQMWSPRVILIPSPAAPSTLPAPRLANSARSPGSPASAPRPPRRAAGARGGGRPRRSAPLRAPGELPAPSPRAEVKRSWRRTATRGRDWGGQVEEELAASSRRWRLVFSPALRFRRRLAPHPLLLCLAPSRRSSGSSHGGGAGFPFLSGGASLSSGGLGSSSPPRSA